MTKEGGSVTSARRPGPRALGEPCTARQLQIPACPTPSPRGNASQTAGIAQWQLRGAASPGWQRLAAAVPTDSPRSRPGSDSFPWLGNIHTAGTAPGLPSGQHSISVCTARGGGGGAPELLPVLTCVTSSPCPLLIPLCPGRCHCTPGLPSLISPSCPGASCSFQRRRGKIRIFSFEIKQIIAQAFCKQIRVGRSESSW